MPATYYLDTSALVKRYHPERGTAYLDTVFAEPDATFIIASITIAELTSAIVRKHEEGTSLGRASCSRFRSSLRS
jgi:predicted nucleic acid-binding protein